MPITVKNVVLFNDSISQNIDSPEGNAILFWGNGSYSYQKNRSEKYQLATAEELAKQGKILRESEAIIRSFAPLPIQNFDFRGAYQKKRSSLALLLQDFFTLENELRTISAIDAMRVA